MAEGLQSLHLPAEAEGIMSKVPAEAEGLQSLHLSAEGEGIMSKVPAEAEGLQSLGTSKLTSTCRGRGNE